MITNSKRFNVALPVCTRHSSYNSQCYNCYQVADFLEREKREALATSKQLAALQTVVNSRIVTPVGLPIPLVSKAMRKLV
jgi:hypothetical protein